MQIGLFDSGVGGLSILAALHALWPAAALDYLADSAYAPYGERSDDLILARSTLLATQLLDDGAQALVVACNTATAVAIDALRARWPALPIIGVEPGVKPAVAASRSGRIAVMATEATLRHARVHRLIEQHAGSAQVHLQACDGLAAAIERGTPDDPALAAVVHRHCRAVAASGADAVALGCTHYPFARRLIETELGPGVTIIDTSEAVARRVVALCRREDAAGEPAAVHLRATGDVAALRRMAEHWLAFACTIDLAPEALGRG